jgi:S-adenosylmethionine hydrolase
MIVLVTDFGLVGPYVGQLMRVFHEQAPGDPVVTLFADAPVWNPKAAAYLLPPYTGGFPAGTVFVCVVDPGVGSHSHAPAAVRCDARWFIGPDNGLFELVRRRAREATDFRIAWRPPELSASFHGRDLYAPTAARLARGIQEGLEPAEGLRMADWPDDLPEVIYIDHYGNAMTGLRASQLDRRADLLVGRARLRPAHTFAAVARGEAFWYENSNGLVEIAVNQGRAADVLRLAIGDVVTPMPPA